MEIERHDLHVPGADRALLSTDLHPQGAAVVDPGRHPLDDQPEHLAYREELHWDKQLEHPLRKRDNVSAHLWPIASVRGLKLFREAMDRIGDALASDRFAIEATSSTRLAYVLTGDTKLDETSRSGLIGLGLVLETRTSVVPDESAQRVWKEWVSVMYRTPSR